MFGAAIGVVAWASRGSVLTTGAVENACLYDCAGALVGASGEQKKQYGMRGGPVLGHPVARRQSPRGTKSDGVVDKTTENSQK